MIYLFLFILGACIGSFLNVVIDRLSTGRSIVAGRSYCEHCKKILSPIDLIPLVSFLMLKGRCRYCNAKIPARFFFIELLIGVTLPILFFYSQIHLLPISVFIFLAVIILSFLAIFFADVIYGIIPDALVVISGVFTLLYLYFTSQPVITNFLIGVGALFFFLFLFLATKGRGMGFGDVKLSFVLGFLLGFPNILVALYLAFLTGAGVSIILVIWKKVSFSKGTIPFGPFLIFTTLLAFFLGKSFIVPFILRFL